MDDLPIVDAHHHLWDLGRNHYPWLADHVEGHGFLGDYSALRRNYLPADYRRRAAGFHVGATVHIQAEVVRDIPNIPVVLNHTGFPWDRSPEGLAAWRTGMAALARCPNVHLKISELGLRDRPWTVEGNRGVVRDAIAIFGIERCMFAS